MEIIVHRWLIGFNIIRVIIATTLLIGSNTITLFLLYYYTTYCCSSIELELKIRPGVTYTVTRQIKIFTLQSLSRIST